MLKRAADVLAEATARLAQAEIPEPGRDARRLLAHILKVPAGRLTLFLPEPISDPLQASFLAVIERRAARVPVSHLIGRRMFYGRDFIVTPDVLDPRPETETLIEVALAEPFATVLDLGTGSGAILLSLLSERDGAVGIGTDLSGDALQVAYWNRNALQLEDRADLRKGDWFQALDSDMCEFDLIVSNPPYIAESEIAALSPEVRNYEPRLALTDEGDGLSAYRQITAQAYDRLAPMGRLIVEIGPTQSSAVCKMMAHAGFEAILTIPDLDGRDRVISARRAK